MENGSDADDRCVEGHPHHHRHRLDLGHIVSGARDQRCGGEAIELRVGEEHDFLEQPMSQVLRQTGCGSCSQVTDHDSADSRDGGNEQHPPSSTHDVAGLDASCVDAQRLVLCLDSAGGASDHHGVSTQGFNLRIESLQEVGPLGVGQVG